MSLLSSLVLSLNAITDLLLYSFLGLGGCLGEVDSVVLLIPDSEWSGINGDDGVLDESLGSDQLVVGGIVKHVHNSGFAGDGLGSPGEITSFKAKSAEFKVATTSTNNIDLLGTQLCHCRRATKLELALLLVDVPAASGGAVLVSAIARNTHLHTRLCPE